MCGLLGEFCFHSNAVSSEKEFERLLKLSKHRGPDVTDVFRSEGLQLGFNRLAILDLSERGNQPKRSPSGRYILVFNGEIYNYKELIDAYDLSNLHSTSDTEVILHLLDRLGIAETIKLLNGMFGIAVHDTSTDSFCITRDFAGIKPLFYGVSEKGIVAASQFDQIFNHEWFKQNLELSANAMKDYFGFGYMQAPNTIYKNIFQVKPGQCITFDRKGRITHAMLIDFSNSQDSKLKNTSGSFDMVLRDAVKRQLRSDVPVASFLSGGIDSPLISAMAKLEHNDIEAFTIAVDDETLNESEIAALYAKHLKIKQQVVKLSPSEILDHVNDHFLAYSEPFGDYSSIPTFVITEKAKQAYTVMLSGDGGDELFAGYPRMLDVLKKRFWFKIPFVLRKTIAQITNRLKITNTWAPYFKSIDAYILNKHVHIPQHIIDQAFYRIDYSEAITDLYTFKNSSRSGLLHELRYNEFYAHMQRILIKVDRASMKHSLEVRIPLLDKECIDYAWNSVPALNFKSDLKKELKDTLAKHVPEAIINKKKMGFTVPINDWLRNELKDDVIDMVLKRPFFGEEVFDSKPLKLFVSDFFDGKHQDSWGVWHIYAWQKWSDIHIH